MFCPQFGSQLVPKFGRKWFWELIEILVLLLQMQLNICYWLTLVRFVNIYLWYVWKHPHVESVVCELSIPVCATTFFEWCASMVFLLWKDMLNLNMSDLVKKTSEAVCRRYYSDDLLYISSKKYQHVKILNMSGLLSTSFHVKDH